MTETMATAEEEGQLYPFVPKSSGCLLQNVSQMFVTGVCVKQNRVSGTSWVAGRLRIHLPRQGTRVQSLVWEDPNRHRATKPVQHNSRSLLKPEPVLRDRRSRCSGKPHTATKRSTHLPQEKPLCSSEVSVQPN